MNRARRLDRQDINRRRTPPLMPNVRDAGSSGSGELCGCDQGTPAIPATAAELARFGTRLFAEAWLLQQLDTLLADYGFSATAISVTYDGVSDTGRNLWLVELARTCDIPYGDGPTVDPYDLLLTTDATGFALRLSPQGEPTCPDVIDWRWGSQHLWPQPHSTNELALRSDTKTARDSTGTITYVDPPDHCQLCLVPKVAIVCTAGNANLASWRSAKIVSSLTGCLVQQEKQPLQFGNADNPHCTGVAGEEVAWPGRTWYGNSGESIEVVTLRGLGLTAASPTTAFKVAAWYSGLDDWHDGYNQPGPPGVCWNAVYDVGRLRNDSVDFSGSVPLTDSPRLYATPVLFQMITTAPESGLVSGRFEVALGLAGGCRGTGCSSSRIVATSWYAKILRTFTAITLAEAKVLATNALAASGKVIHLAGAGSAVGVNHANPTGVSFPSTITIQCTI